MCDQIIKIRCWILSFNYASFKCHKQHKIIWFSFSHRLLWDIVIHTFSVWIQISGASLKFGFRMCGPLASENITKWTPTLNIFKCFGKLSSSVFQYHSQYRPTPYNNESVPQIQVLRFPLLLPLCHDCPDNVQKRTIMLDIPCSTLNYLVTWL